MSKSREDKLLRNQYYDLQTNYEGIYGENTIVLMQVGKFYEIYSKENGGFIEKASDIMEIRITRKTDMEGNVFYTSGVPYQGVRKFLDKLVRRKYTVVVMDQVGPAKLGKHQTRGITKIVDETNIDLFYASSLNSHTLAEVDANIILSIYVEEERTIRGEPAISIGFSVINSVTSISSVYEITGEPGGYVYEEMYRFIESCNPAEIIVQHGKGWGENEGLGKFMDPVTTQQFLKNKPIQYDQKIKSVLDKIPILMSRRVVRNDFFKKDEYYKVSWQTELLRKLFPACGSVNPIEYIGLERKYYALQSYVFLLQFVYEHVFNTLTNIPPPTIYDCEKHLNLYNNVLYQLDITPNPSKRDSDGDSLFDILDKTATTMGKKELKDRLLNPIVDVQHLRQRYSAIDKMNTKIEIFSKLFGGIYDMDKFQNKIKAGTVTPRELAMMDRSYRSILDIIRTFNEYYTYEEISADISITDDDFVEFQKYYDCYSRIFNIDVLVKTDLDDIEESFFNIGMYPEIDALQDEINSANKKLQKIADSYSNLLTKCGTKRGGSRKKKAAKLTTDENENEEEEYDEEADGKKVFITSLKKEKGKKKSKDSNDRIICLQTTEVRAIFIRDELKKLAENGSANEIKIDKKYIRSAEIDKLSAIIVDLSDKLNNKCQQYYKDSLKMISGFNIVKIPRFIAVVDVILSSSKNACYRGYCCPEIMDINEHTPVRVAEDIDRFVDGNSKCEESCVDSCANCDQDSMQRLPSCLYASALRHPIVESKQTATNFIPNDVVLDPVVNKTGMLLYGMNQAGKSILMKSVGLAVIMAQAGMFVPARCFRYRPFTRIFTRISGDDNLHYGKSSFAIEMDELRSILRFSDANSLILGDEVCRGTESVSGLAIVSSSLIRFASKNISHIFATHLHQLCEMDCVKELKSLIVCHLATTVSGDTITYNRRIQSGPGDSIYGLEVAKCLIGDKDFIDTAYRIRNGLTNAPTEIVSSKGSHFNSELYVDACQICGKTYMEVDLDVHHILFQSSCNKFNLAVGHVRKNTKSNLVVLCKKHHQETHKDLITISGYRDTTRGVTLEYKLNYPIETPIIDNENTGVDMDETFSMRSRKYEAAEIEFVRNYYKNNSNFNKRYTIEKLKSDFGIEISITTFNKMVRGIRDSERIIPQ